MANIINEWGLWGLFFSSFISSTLLPGGSEAILAASRPAFAAFRASAAVLTAWGELGASEGTVAAAVNKTV